METNSVLVCSVFNIIGLLVPVDSVFLDNVVRSIGNVSFLSVLGSRLLVNLREAGELGLNQGTNYRPSSRTVSDINFAEMVVKGERPILFPRKKKYRDKS